MKRRSTIFILCLLFGSQFACSVFAKDKQEPPPVDEAISVAEVLDIAEATFLYQFEHNASGAQQKAGSYFLSLFGKDPTDQFFKRFKENKPPVKKGSEFKIGQGLKFKISRMKWISPAKVEVLGGYYESRFSASGCRYTVELKDNKWVVTERKLLGGA